MTHASGRSGVRAIHGVASRSAVLVVGDTLVAPESVASDLASDFDVVTATSADAAFAMLRARPAHVVCADFHTPGMNGLEKLLRGVASLATYTSTLLLTAVAEHATETDGRHYVLLKPYDRARLVGLVAQLARVAQMKRSVERLTTVVRRGSR